MSDKKKSGKDAAPQQQQQQQQQQGGKKDSKKDKPAAQPQQQQQQQQSKKQDSKKDDKKADAQPPRSADDAPKKQQDDGGGKKDTNKKNKKQQSSQQQQQQQQESEQPAPPNAKPAQPAPATNDKAEEPASASAKKEKDNKKKDKQADKKEDAPVPISSSGGGGGGGVFGKKKKDKAAAVPPQEAGEVKEVKEQGSLAEDKRFRANVEDLLRRRFFYVPAFEIYGGVGGLYDFGPPGCGVKDNLLTFWRNHFVLTENMLEVSCSALTPYVVLKTSGHVDKFTDFMVKDEKTGECYRADKLLEDHIDALLEEKKDYTDKQKADLLAIRTQAGAYNKDELAKVLTQLNVKSPDAGNPIGPPFPFNLMFETQIGPTGKFVGYLRPETAQGIFVNFRRLLESNGSRMPFAAAQIGLAFRNEIAPRSGLLRVREFPLAEIEHFVNPMDKRHAKFAEVKDHVLTLLAREDQTGEDIPKQITAGKAVADRVINNETLAYFMVRTHLFLTGAGIKPNKLRFRQHKSTEMAHYAKDCWDAEVHTTYGWVEVVGHADRAAYDLEVHSAKSHVDLIAHETFDTPREVEVARVIIDFGKIGKTFKDGAKVLTAHLKALDKTGVEKLAQDLKNGPTTLNIEAEVKGKKEQFSFTVTPDMLKTEVKIEKQSSIKYIPSVIEPSFGIGRIMYGILEHSYTQRDPNDEKRSYLALPAIIAPVKVAILPISGQDVFDPYTAKLSKAFLALNLYNKIDSSNAALGRRYARADEIGTPFAITVDFDTIKDNSVTIRERDSMTQVRVDLAQAVSLVGRLCTGALTWTEVYDKHPRVVRKEDKDEE